MKFSEIVEQAKTLLRRKERISYRALKLEFDLDDEQLDILKEELVDIEELAIDKDGKMLVWVGESSPESRVKTANPPDSSPQTLDPKPISYTPPHLAERIRAVEITDGERKTITALFADLKGSTALIEGLDPEEARAIIDPALQVMMDAVHRYEGYVAQVLGDGIFALFGAPIAHEDHPQRALFAALRMQDEMRRYGDQIRLKHGAPLAMRIGINTGEVVVRSIRKDDLHTDYVPVGHSTNLAARMEQMATPGSILVTAHTHKLTDGYFAFKALGQMQIKGVEEPLDIYEVVGAGSLRTRLQVTATRHGLTRFVGRQSEMEQLCKALEQAKAGHGQIVGVMGEPGLGKSRLFYEFVGAYSNTPLLILQAYSVSHGKATAYLPVIELLKSYFRIETQDDERTRREKVTGKVLNLDRSSEDTLPYLFALLGIEEQPSPLQQMDAQIRRRRTFEALKKLFLRESFSQPLVLIFEDLHWIDGETQGFLDTLSESVASAKLLLLTNYRPEYRHEWGQKTYYTQLRLAPFGKTEAEEFLDELLGQHRSPLPARARDRVRGDSSAWLQLKHLILDKTEGTPFFMEEVVQTLVEDGTLMGERGTYTLTQPVATLHLPTTVQGVLAARIDRLVPDEKALLQQLAVIGREFPLSLVRQVIAQPEDEIYRILSALQHKEFLYEQPAFPDVEYIFKHALTQEVAYGTVLQERRKALHEQTAHAIEQLFHDRLEEHYSALVHHYSRSGNTEKAIEYLHLAGQQAVQRSANVEAIGHLTDALNLLNMLPDTPERGQQEIALQITIGTALIVTKGFAAPEVGQTYTRARQLCQEVGETSQAFPVLIGLWVFFLIRAELQTAHTLGEQLMRRAQNLQDSALLVEAHWALGETLLYLGELVPARALLEQGVTLYDPQQHRSHVFLYGQDPGVVCLTHAAWTLWLLGYPDQALNRIREALTLARELSHPHTLGHTLAAAAFVYQLCREGQATRAMAESSIELANEWGFPFWLALGTIWRGWSLAEQGQGAEGIIEIRQGIAAWQAIGGEAVRPYYLALLAETCERLGQSEEGLTLIAEGLAHIDKTSERREEAELYRMKGELTLQSKIQGPKSKVEEAEACFHKAIEIARHQQAKSLELRATMSLARLWQQQGKQREAHDLLAAIYHWFTEGFDTKDLREAKALIEELSHHEDIEEEKRRGEHKPFSYSDEVNRADTEGWT